VNLIWIPPTQWYDTQQFHLSTMVYLYSEYHTVPHETVADSLTVLCTQLYRAVKHSAGIKLGHKPSSRFAAHHEQRSSLLPAFDLANPVPIWSCHTKIAEKPTARKLISLEIFLPYGRASNLHVLPSRSLCCLAGYFTAPRHLSSWRELIQVHP